MNRTSLERRQAEMKARHRPPRPVKRRGRKTHDELYQDAITRERYVQALARTCAELWLRQGLDTVTIACRLRDAFSLRYVNAEKVQRWIDAGKPL